MKDYDPDRMPPCTPGFPLIFTLWPEWRDYDGILDKNKRSMAIIFLPCDLNEGITTFLLLLHRSQCDHFYLVTWMKGLRPGTGHHKPVPQQIFFTLWPEWRDYDIRQSYLSKLSCIFLPCDLNEGITTRPTGPIPVWNRVFLPCDLNEGITPSFEKSTSYTSISFLPVTWMKGLRPARIIGYTMISTDFYLVTWMKEYDINIVNSPLRYAIRFFTLWPEWRDYDKSYLNNWYKPV